MKLRRSRTTFEPLPPLPEQYRRGLNRVVYPREAPEDDQLRLGALAAALLLLLMGAVLVLYGVFDGNWFELGGGVVILALVAVNVAASEWWRRHDLDGLQRVFADLPIWICAVLGVVTTVASFIGIGWAVYELLKEPFVRGLAASVLLMVLLSGLLTGRSRLKEHRGGPGL